MNRTLRGSALFLPPAIFLGALFLGEGSATPAGIVRFAMGSATGTDSQALRLLMQIRLPLVVQAFFCGGLLAVSGAALQAILRNPLAEPFVLGVSSGAALGMVLVSLLGAGGLFIIHFGAAFAGGILASFFVLGGAVRRGRSFSITRLILLGVAVNAFLSALTMLLQSFLDPYRFTASVGLLMGEVSLYSSGEMLLALAIGLPGAFLLWYRAPELDILSQGRETALAIGVRTDRVLFQTVVAASLATAVSVAMCGVIGFVGLAAPHIVRALWGNGHRRLFPLSFLFGGAFLVMAHFLIRIISTSATLPLTAITALAGAPFFFWIIRTYGGSDA